MLCYVTPNRENLIAMAKECKICGASYVRSRREAYGLCPTCVFWSLVDKTSSPCGCWLWTGKLDRDGYGDFTMTTPSGQRERHTNRVSWSLDNIAIPIGLCVLHSCEGFYQPGDFTGRRCVNPDHLRIGTNADNTLDCINSGRFPRGPTSGNTLHPERLPRGDQHHSRLHPEMLARGVNAGLAKLSDDIVREIRASSETLKAIGARLGVHFSTIAKIRTGQTWRHVV
jgi:hypothetical protein